MSASTQTGVPIRDCTTCGHAHPISRSHCATCQRPTAFIDPTGDCDRCARKDTP